MFGWCSGGGAPRAATAVMAEAASAWAPAAAAPAAATAAVMRAIAPAAAARHERVDEVQVAGGGALEAR